MVKVILYTLAAMGVVTLLLAANSRAIDELPATYAIRPLVVISIVKQVAKHPGYSPQVSDIERWETRHGKIPAGSVVMVRSDWSKEWPDPALVTRPVFPGVSLAALKFLHEQRHILFHGHEPLDTDATPTLDGEHWLMHHGYTQTDGVANLVQVPETGCLTKPTMLPHYLLCADILSVVTTRRFARGTLMNVFRIGLWS
jgi:kynurenine formamidase